MREEDCKWDSDDKLIYRQIIKTEYSTCVAAGQYSTVRSHSAIIYYVELADVRDAKIDNVLEIK